MFTNFYIPHWLVNFFIYSILIPKCFQIYCQLLWKVHKNFFFNLDEKYLEIKCYHFNQPDCYQSNYHRLLFMFRLNFL